MFCRYCGKTLTNTLICPRCGRENGPLEGGNGFRDILEEPVKNRAEPLQKGTEDLRDRSIGKQKSAQGNEQLK